MCSSALYVQKESRPQLSARFVMVKPINMSAMLCMFEHTRKHLSQRLGYDRTNTYPCSLRALEHVKLLRRSVVDDDITACPPIRTGVAAKWGSGGQGLGQPIRKR